MRLVLFDVDGTLLSSGPPARAAFSTALQDVFGTAGSVDTYAFEGKLDPVIVEELMREAGVSDDIIARRVLDSLELYLDRLQEALAVHSPQLKPGVRELVDAVASHPGAVNALLTGNVERGARIKLTAAGLWNRFVFGVWGNEAPTRVGLGPVALARAARLTGRSFRGEDCVVVGDSTHDVACGRAIGARVVAVTTGRTSRAALEAAGADVIFEDFADLRAASEAILG